MIKEKIRELMNRHRELEHQLSLPETTTDSSKMEKLGREYNGIQRNLPVFKEYLSLTSNLDEARLMLESETDEDILELARDDVERCEAALPDLEQKVKMLLVPRDPRDMKNAVMEIRAGTGGTEAGIFGADLFRMYQHFVDTRGWTIEVLSSSYGEVGALKEIIFIVKGENAYGTLKYESGVHRVQRVPLTEAQGRVHTSAASVAVFPEADDVEITINPNDLRIDLYCSSGPGGQSVNTTYSAVRIVHVPTGITVTCQDEKSQHKNKAKALKVLQTRLYEKEMAEKEAQETAERRSMVSTGDRSAKIRTYNFPQNRLTDHRINLTLYSLDRIINGEVDELVDALSIADLNERVEKSGMK